VQAVLEMPDYTVAEFETAFLEKWIVENIEREDFAVLNVVSDLPA